MKLRLSTFLLFSLFLSFSLHAQLTGLITDAKGEVLSFASIYIQGSSRGTTSNIDGVYDFDLEEGRHTIVFQYVGYQQKVIVVDMGKTAKKLNVQLEEEAVSLSEVVVSANAEDPAYAVIRKAIAKREYYRNLIDGFSCKVYIKGMQKILAAPEKILGQEIGDLGGSLDSNRQGIVYLSESEALLHYKRPNQMKEQMISTKVSGNDNGFGFNRASLMNFNLYDNHVEVERQILSPIADNALSYYRYKLLGTLYDEEGRLINKIKVIPKRKEDPVFRGTIYITEDLWNIQSTHLILTGASIKQPVLDSLVITQVHVPVKEPDTWMMFSQNIDFGFGLFGFKIHGIFEGIFSDYELNPVFEDRFFNNELFKVEEGANDKDLSYWDTIRPIPLTVEEELDYIKKDSLQEVWESKHFRDSVDKKNNRLKPLDLLFGYSYRNSYKKRRIAYGSPLTKIQYNTVQGYNGVLDLSFRQDFDDYFMRWYSINPRIDYGLEEKTFRADGAFTFNFNRTHYTRLTLSGGRRTAQFNENDAVSRTLNTFYSWVFRKNYLKLFDKNYGRIDFRHELLNGLYMRTFAEYSHRRPLVNNSSQSLFNKDRVYDSNNPLSPRETGESFEAHRAYRMGISLRIRPKQQYLTYPGRKYILGSKWPELWVHYTKAIPLTDNYVDYDLLRLVLSDDFTLGLVGRSELRLEGGTFLRKERLEFIDFKHFRGNQYAVADPSDYIRSFFHLPFYEYSTNSAYLQFNYQHYFEGYILDKLPLMRKLNWKMVVGANFLYTKEQKDYMEFSAGIDNIGFGALRLFRIDVAAVFKERKYQNLALVFGVDL